MSSTILVIEDDPIIGSDLQQKLESLGYQVIGVTDTKEKAVELVREHEPRLILADIILETQEYDGIDVVGAVFENYRCPVIYLTASSEHTTVKRAAGHKPSAFLLKPFRLKELAINIDIALNSFESEVTFGEVNRLAEDSVFIPNNSVYYRIPKKEIISVEADGSYTRVKTSEKTYSMSINLKQFTLQLDDDRFIRISRKNLINSEHIERIEGRNLTLSDGAQVKISRSKSQEILERFPILRSG